MKHFWRTIYVLSCPSSTGQGGDDAGFNIIHFGPHVPRRPHGVPFRDHALFAAAQRRAASGRSTRICRTASSGCRRDGIFPAIRPFRSPSRSPPAPTLKRDQAAAILRAGCCMRRSFYRRSGEPELGWTCALHLSRHVAGLGRSRRQVLRGPDRGLTPRRWPRCESLLDRLIAHSADAARHRSRSSSTSFGRRRLDQPRRRPARGADAPRADVRGGLQARRRADCCCTT